VIPGIIAAVTSGFATAQAIPSLSRRDTFAIARHWLVSIAVGSFVGVAAYMILNLAAVALSILAKPISHATFLLLDVLFTAISFAAGGAMAGWVSARLHAPQLLNIRHPDSDAA
jgi:hypothetical protein